MVKALDQLITIEILGHPFTFKADSNVSEAKEVAEYFVKEVDRMSEHFNNKNVMFDKRAITILAALNITNQYFEYKRKYSALLSNLNEKSTQLLNRLNSSNQ